MWHIKFSDLIYRRQLKETRLWNFFKQELQLYSNLPKFCEKIVMEMELLATSDFHPISFLSSRGLDIEIQVPEVSKLLLISTENKAQIVCEWVKKNTKVQKLL